jgi:hypothetical protein
MEKTAFPVNSRWDSGNKAFDLCDTGMTLRDYFAGCALTGLFNGDVFIDSQVADHLAEQCYTVADAMMCRRDKGRTNKGNIEFSPEMED